VDLDGVSAPGEYASMVDHAAVRILGRSHLPGVAPRVSLARLMTGAEDGQWVEMEGVVHSVVNAENHVIVSLALSEGIIRATTVPAKGIDYQSLVDAKILIHGNAAPFFNKRRQIVAASLYFPDLSSIVVEERAEADAYSLPVRSIATLLRYFIESGSATPRTRARKSYAAMAGTVVVHRRRHRRSMRPNATNETA
jgi:hypothetical protein